MDRSKGPRPDPNDEMEVRPAGDMLPPMPTTDGHAAHSHAGTLVQAEEGEDTRLSTVSGDKQSYAILVWRRFRKSIPGMLGLILVAALLVVSAFAPFFAPVDPKASDSSFIPPDTISWYVPGEGPQAGWRLMPVSFPIVESDELDPITYQPLNGPDYDNPRTLGFFVSGWEYRFLGITFTRHFFGTTDGSPLHILGTDKLGRDILSRGIVGSRISLTIALVSITLITIIGTLLGITSGYIGGRFDMWFQRFVEIILAFPQLPLYLALATLIPVTAPSGLFITFVILVIVGLGWAQLSREVRSKTLGPAAGRLCPRRDGRGRGRRPDHHPPHPAQRHEPCDRRRDAGHPDHRAARELPRVPRLCRQGAADLLGPDASGRRHLRGDRQLSMDPHPRRLRPPHRVRVQRARRRSARCRRSVLRGAKMLDMGKAKSKGGADGPLIDARNIGVTFKVDGGHVEAVRDVSFQLRAGQTIALVGESGSGKSVTARAVMQLLSKRARVHDGCQILYDGRDMAHLSVREMRALRGNRLAMIFQEPMSSLNPVYTVGAQLCEVLILHQRLSKKAAMARAVELLDEVRIPDAESRVNNYPHQLSGGQRQRVMIAMALANRPDVLIADEPTTALDVTVQAEILHLIAALKEKYGMGVILITHDLTVVRQFADHVYVMQHGAVVEDRPDRTGLRHARPTPIPAACSPRIPRASPIRLRGRARRC